jgi:serine/threonine-protein kinase
MLAGSTAGLSGWLDAQGTNARFVAPAGVAVDPSALTVYVGDNFGNRVRRVSPSGLVSTFLGSGSSGSAEGTGAAATFSDPSGVGVGLQGTLYVADGGNHKVRKSTATGLVTTLAGLARVGTPMALVWLPHLTIPLALR